VQGIGERHLERADFVAPAVLDLDRAVGQAVEAHQVRERARAVDLAAAPAGDLRDVERVVEVGVADQHRARRRHVAVDQRRVRAQGAAAEQRVACARARQVGIDQQDMVLMADGEACGAEPAQGQARGSGSP
jgi:hypothetical protein